jgi:hypothetical protein
VQIGSEEILLICLGIAYLLEPKSVLQFLSERAYSVAK